VPRQPDVAEHLEVPAGAPGCVVDFLDRARRNVAGIVDEHVDFRAGVDQLLPARLLRKIEREDLHVDLGAPAHRRRLALEQVPGACRQAQMAAFAREPLRDREADSFRRAGDEHRATCELQIHPDLRLYVYSAT